MADQIITEPSIEPVTTAEQKSHMRVDISTDDTLIENLVKSARIIIEKLTGLKLISQVWKLVLDEFPSEDYIELPYWPVISVDEIKTIDVDETEAVFSSDNYVTDLISIPATITLKDDQEWTDPAAGYQVVNGVEIKFTCGYGTSAADVPEPLKLAIKMLAAHFYENREATAIVKLNELPMGISSLIENYRTYFRGAE